MSKYSLLGVCQPQRGGLSYFWGLSLRLARAATRDETLRSKLSTEAAPLSFLRDWPWEGGRREAYLCLPHPPPSFWYQPFFPREIFLLPTLSDIERHRVARSIMLMRDFANYVIAGGTGETRKIAGFGNLNSRAGFTVSRETRTP